MKRLFSGWVHHSSRKGTKKHVILKAVGVRDQTEYLSEEEEFIPRKQGKAKRAAVNPKAHTHSGLPQMPGQVSTRRPVCRVLTAVLRAEGLQV